MSRQVYVRTLAIAGLLLLQLFWCAAPQAATPASWKDSGFSINAGAMTLRSVFEEFSRAYGVRLSMEIDGDRLVKGGRIKADNGVEFLNRLGGIHRFRWFVYNDTLYVTPAGASTSLRIEVGEDAVQDAKSALIGLGLFDDRFGWGELPDEGVVIVSGPRSYVELARDTLLPKEKKTARKGRQIMMFRLKYASATDRTINSRGKSETIPGVKTILGNLLFGPHSAEKVTDPKRRFDADSSKRSRSPKLGKGEAAESGGEGLAPLFTAPDSAGKNRVMAEDGGTQSSRGQQQQPREEEAPPRIEADSTLNAIMIYDNINKKEMYAALIAELDVQPQQIEIEAMIVDIDRSKLADMGVEWGVRAGVVNGVFNSTTQSSQGTSLPLPGATLLISDAGRFYARLKAMQSTGEARVLATPTILTLDNVPAVLDLSRSAYVSLVGERVADLADVTAGTMLRVIPRIIHDGGQTRVRLEVDIEDGTLDSPDSVSGADGKAGSVSAAVTRSTISTQAIIDAQQTLMIGGYHAESLKRDKQKVPLLGDLPLLGGLFRSETQSDSTRERLFLITPRISGSDGIEHEAMSGRPVAAAAKEKPVTVLEKSVAVEAAPLLSTAQSAAQDSVVIGSGLRLPPRKFKCTPARRVGML
jgi:type III secretion protein C